METPPWDPETTNGINTEWLNTTETDEAIGQPAAEPINHEVKSTTTKALNWIYTYPETTRETQPIMYSNQKPFLDLLLLMTWQTSLSKNPSLGTDEWGTTACILLQRDGRHQTLHPNH